METKVYIKKTLVHDQTISELDLELQEKFTQEVEDLDDDFEFIEICDMEGDAGGYPMSIDMLIAELNHLKSKGANYVGIDYDCDHYGYIISGYEIRKAEHSEIKEYEIELETINLAYWQKRLADAEKGTQNISNEITAIMAKMQELNG
jgi:hypothetical protein